MTFTQPLCDDCWDEENPESLSPRRGQGDHELCCKCGMPTRAGIYIRRDPATVRYPRAEPPDDVIEQVASSHPTMSTQLQALGRKRLDEHMGHNSNLQFQLLTLNMSILVAPRSSYADEALAAVIDDARDVLEAAREYAHWAVELAEAWRAQRQELVV